MRPGLPYWHRHGVGVAFDRAAVRVVALRAQPGRVAVAAHGEERVGAGGAGAALARLVERLDLPVPEVATHVRPERLVLERAPSFEDREDLDGWLRSRTTDAAPDLVVRASPLSEPGGADPDWEGGLARSEGAVCAFAEAGTAEVEERLAWVRAAGLVPASLGTAALETEALLPYADDPHPYLVGPATLVVCGEADEATGAVEADVLRLQDGRPSAYAYEHAGVDVAARSAAALASSDLRGGTGDVPIAVTGPGAEAVRHALSDLGRAAQVLRPFGLSPAYARAAALAAAALDGPPTLDFLPPADALLASEDAEKREAQRAMLGIGALLLLVLLVGVGGTALAGSMLARTEDALAGHAAVLAGLETERQAVVRLERAVAVAGGLAAEQTHTAEAFAAVARAVPPTARLLRAHRAATGLLELEGLATPGIGIADVMAGVEAGFSGRPVRLVVAERLAGRPLARAASRADAPREAIPSDPAVWFRIDVEPAP